MIAAFLAFSFFALQGEVAVGQTVRLATPSDGYRLKVKPPASNFRIDLKVTCERPGVLLDTVGINAAPTGSYTMEVSADRTVSFRVWQPGWTDVHSKTPMGTSEAHIVVERRDGKVTISVDDKTVASGGITAALSQQDLWIGDFPGDDSWGSKFRIHPAMVGSVQVVAIGSPSADRAVGPELFTDQTGKVDAALKARITQALNAIAQQTGGRLYVVFSSDTTTDLAIQTARRTLERAAAANPDVPCGVLAYGIEGVKAYSRTTTFDPKLGIDRIKSTWDASVGSTIAEKVASQLDQVAGRTVQKTVMVGEATIGPEGGTITSQNRDFEMTIPAGALSATQTMRVQQTASGAYGCIYAIDGSAKLLAKPATIRYKLPAGLDPDTVVPAGQLDGPYWMVHARTYDPATRTLIAKVSHFSNQGWFGLGNTAHKAMGASVSSFTGSLLIVVAEYGLLGATAEVTVPMFAVVSLFGAVGWFAGGAEYDHLMKEGYEGPIPVSGFELYWKPNDVAGGGSCVALIDKRTNKILTWVKDSDVWQPSASGGTFQIQMPDGVDVQLGDIRAVKVPKALLTLSGELEETRRWYQANGFKPPENTPILVTKDVEKLSTGERNAGEFDGRFFLINGEMLSASPTSSSAVRATIAHEYFHVIAKDHGYHEQFLGSEEAIAVALESIVMRGATDGLTLNGWGVVGPILKNGLKGDGTGEGYKVPDRRGYLLWSFPKFIFHRHGVADLRALAEGTMADALFVSMFRAYTRALTNRDDGLGKTEDDPDGRGPLTTGWPVPLTQMAQSVSKAGVPAGSLEVKTSAPAGFQVLTVRVPARVNGGPAPVVIRRRVPFAGEELFVLKPSGAGGQAASVSSEDRGRDDVIIGTGVVTTPPEWDLGEMILPVAVSNVVRGEEQANPLLVYRLVPPPQLEAPVAADGLHVKWQSPNFSGLSPADVLWGYYVYGKTASGDVRLIAELRANPDQSPNRLSERGGSRTAVTISPTSTDVSLPGILGTAFQSFGIASVDLVAMNGSQPLVSEITWTNAPADELLKELQRMEQLTVRLSGVADVKFDSPTATNGVNEQLAVTSWFGFQAAIVKTAKDFGKPVAPVTLTWAGSDFSLSIATGTLDSTSSTDRGTTVTQISQSLTMRGRYDSKRRGVVDVSAVYESKSTSDFTPNPNWKPRSTVDSFYPPKASKSVSRELYRVVADFVPYVTKSVDQSGNTLMSFKLDTPKLNPGCVADREQESTVTDKPPVKLIHRITAGPALVGVAVYPPGILVEFVLPKR